jgi:hypothetical protein
MNGFAWVPEHKENHDVFVCNPNKCHARDEHRGRICFTGIKADALQFESEAACKDWIESSALKTLWARLIDLPPAATTL